MTVVTAYRDELWKPLAAAFVLAAFAVVPLFTGIFYTGVMTQVLFWTLFAMSLDLLMGFGGLPSLGHAAFFGLGAYAVGILHVHAGVESFWINLLAGMAAATVGAAVFGLFMAHTSQMSFFIITLTFAQILWGLAFRWFSVTGGETGLIGITQPEVLGWSVETATDLYYLTLVVVGIGVALVFAVAASPFGRSVIGIKESPERMAALGYNVWLHKYVLIVVSGFFAGLAGAMAAYYNRFVGPDYLSIDTSVTVMLIVILGGAGTLVGSALGAFLILLLEVRISSWTERWLVVMGLLYITVMLLARRGIVGEVRERLRLRRVAAESSSRDGGKYAPPSLVGTEKRGD